MILKVRATLHLPAPELVHPCLAVLEQTSLPQGSIPLQTLAVSLEEAILQQVVKDLVLEVSHGRHLGRVLVTSLAVELAKEVSQRGPIPASTVGRVKQG